MTVHHVGYKILVITALALLALNIFVDKFTLLAAPWPGVIGGASIILFLLILQFFRHPKVNTEKDLSVVYAPADGKVVVVEETEETEYFKEPRIQISIFMSPINVHVNRNPVTGTVKMFKYHAGKYLVAWHPKSSSENERTTLVVEVAKGLDIMIRQIAGAMARRIKCYVSEGDPVIQGEEFGFIRFGSRVDVFLPLDASPIVTVGDKTVAGKTIIARLVEKPLVPSPGYISN